MRPPPRSSLFPYTTLFRSIEERHAGAHGGAVGLAGDGHDAAEGLHQRLVAGAVLARARAAEGRDRAVDQARSEEHTSELQSHSDLVCRLLLEKKKDDIKSA